MPKTQNKNKQSEIDKAIAEVQKARSHPDNGMLKEVERGDSPIKQLKERFAMFSDKNGSGESLKEDQQDRLPLTLAAKFVPIRRIKNGIIETTDGRFAKVLNVTPVNFLLQKEDEQRITIGNFAKYLKVAPAIGHIKSVAGRADMRPYLKKCAKNAQEDPLQTEDVVAMHENYTDLIVSAAREGISRSFYIIYDVEGSGASDKRFEKAEKELNEISETAKTYLKPCGNNVSDMTTHQTAEFLYKFYNRKTSTEKPFKTHVAKVDQAYEQEYGADVDVPIREYVAPTEIDMRSMSYTIMDGSYYTYIMIDASGFHTTNANGWMSMFVNMGDGIDVDLYYERVSAQEMRNRIALRLKINTGQASNAKETDQNASLLRGKVESGRYLLRGIDAEDDFYYMNVLLTISADSFASLVWKKKEVLKRMKSKNYKVNPLFLKQDLGFYTSIPCNRIVKLLKKQTRRNTLTSGLAGAYPLVSFEMSDEDGVVMGYNDANNSLILLNLFNTSVCSNANMAVIGASGAGKTYSAMLIAMRSRLCQIPIYIITPEKAMETARACKKFGGSFISLTLGGKYNINPFDIRPVDSVNEDVINDGAYIKTPLLTQKTVFLKKMFSTILPDITYDGQQYADSAISRVYARYGITSDDDSIYNEDGTIKKMPVFGDIQKELYAIAEEADKVADTGANEARRVARSLNPFVTGTASNFNQQTNVDLDNMFTVVSIADLPDDMRDIGLLIAMDFVYSKAKEDRTQKKMIFFEELWKMVGAAATDDIAKQVLEVFKIIRGYGGSAVAVTQDISDFMAYQNGKFGKGILNACASKIVLRLEPKEAKTVQETLDLTDEELDSVIKMERGKALMLIGRNNLIIDMKSSKLEHDMITTDRADLERIAQENQESA